MASAQAVPDEPLEGDVVGDEDIDLDLDAEDVYLREAIRKPTIVRTGGHVISVPHMLDWEHAATRKANQGDFNGWADDVLTEREARYFKDAHLKNYQIEAIIERASRRSGTSPGKSSRSSNSRRSMARR